MAFHGARYIRGLMDSLQDEEALARHKARQQAALRRRRFVEAQWEERKRQDLEDLRERLEREERQRQWTEEYHEKHRWERFQTMAVMVSTVALGRP